VTIVACAAAGWWGASTASCTTFNGLNATSDSGPPPSDGGAGDVGPDADAGAPGYLSLSDAVKLCSEIFRCPQMNLSIAYSTAVPVDPSNFSLCVHWLAGPIPPDRVGLAAQSKTFACMVAGSSCQESSKCVWNETLDPTDPRCADAGPMTPDRCVDNSDSVLSCYGLYVTHCTSAFYQPGTKCYPYEGGVDCALAPTCNGLAGSCMTYYSFCNTENMQEAIDCSFDGYTCNTSVPDASAACITGNQYKPCSTLGTACSADTKTVESCDGASLSEFDCAALGGVCSQKDGPARCVHPGTDQCSPFDADIDQCTGTTISLCVGGQKAPFDCGSIGLKCVAGSGPQSPHCG
jgi:hypothetical protein